MAGLAGVLACALCEILAVRRASLPCTFLKSNSEIRAEAGFFPAPAGRATGPLGYLRFGRFLPMLIAASGLGHVKTFLVIETAETGRENRAPT